MKPQSLSVKCRLDHRKHKIGIKVSDEEMELVKMKRDEFHSEWNYEI
ncbi:MAG: hypothetical protein LBT62_05440 [Deltaproteobacteria bacterium]|nr:hypothetical protein [Deltaproteobacteria bacterium]